MNPRLAAFVFLIVSFARLVLGQEQSVPKEPNQSAYKPENSRVGSLLIDQSIKKLQEVGQNLEIISQDVDSRENAIKVDKPQSSQVVNQAWLSKQSDALLNIIKILYKGRDAALTELESVQEKMDLSERVERRIALIKATLTERDSK